MNKILFNYLLKNFFKTFLLVTAVFYCFGVILNLFEEIEFFKNTEVSLFLPLVLTCLLIPGMLIKNSSIYNFYFKYVVYVKK